MTTQLNNIRISLKIDDLSNWNNNSNIILNNGEVALIRLPNNQIKIKIGDGFSQLSNLNYLNEKDFFTDKLFTHNAEFGLRNFAQQYSVAEGHNVSAYGAFQHAAGFNVEAISNETFAFVWNGKDLYGYDNTYKSHGAGTFSINPLSGLSGFYIGEEHLAGILYNNISNEIEPLKNSVNQNIATLNNNIASITQATNSLATNFTIVDGKVNELSQDIENKILIDGNNVEQLEVKHISESDYNDLVVNDATLSNAIYIISSDTLDMYGEQIKNLAPGTDLSDAVNLEQMQSTIAQVNENLNDEIANINSSLNNYATKSELTGYAKTSALTSYAAKTDLTSYAKTSALTAYATKTQLTSYATKTDLNNYVKTSSLTSYATKTDLTNNITPLSNDVKTLKSNDSILSSKINNKVLINGLSAEQLEVKHISRDEYYNLVNNNQVLSNAIYMVSADTLNAYGQKIENVADGENEFDAANMRQLSYKLVDIELIDNGTSLSCKLENRTISKITIDSDVKPIVIAFPNIKTGYARDFILQVNVTLASTDNLQIEWEGLDDSWNAISDSDDWAILEPGLNVISFTEMN